MSVSILCVDDDPNILESYRRLFSRRYDVYLAEGPIQGLQKLELGPRYAVIISDKHMPDMDGVEFLRRASERFPMSIRVMLTGDADNETAIDALNRGKIQRFLQKPCPSQTLEKVIAEAVAQYAEAQSDAALVQARRSAAQQLATLLAWRAPAAARLGEQALARAAAMANKKGQTLTEAAVVALRLAELGILSGSADPLEQQSAGAGLLGAMPGWDGAVDLFLQLHGQRPTGELGGLLKLALDMERAELDPQRMVPILEHLRSRHLGNPWFREMEEALEGAENPSEHLALAS